MKNHPGLFFCAMLALVPSLHAQQPAPHIGYVYPAGGKQGTTFQVTLGGQFFDGVSNVFVSGTGVNASVVDFNKPMPQGEFNRLRDSLRELQDKRQAAIRERRRGGAEVGPQSSTNTWTAADEKAMTEIREKILKNPPNRDATPAIAENAIVRITLAADAGVGEREIRLGTPLGLSNPLKFCIGEMPEVSQPPAKAANPDLERFLERLGKPPVKAAAKTEGRITLPAVVNGQITPGGVDRYHFHARKGQNIVAIVHARDLIPYLADAVPGWFQATLAIYDEKGKEVAYDDDFRFHPDPVLHYEIFKEGEYVLEIKDALYRGREDFVYRIEIGELQFVTSIFPLGGRLGERTTVRLNGWNLSTNSLSVDARDTTDATLMVLRGNDENHFNSLPFAVGTLPEYLEKEPNDSVSRAQQIELPAIVNGRIDAPGDQDVFRFNGHAGDELVAEVYARRLDSPLDSVLKLTDATGKQLAFNDDWEDKGCGLMTHHADSYIRARLPADGPYFVHLGDAQHKGGPDFGYRLRLSLPRPDFELRVVPSSVNVRPGASVPLAIFALRKDGFSNEISVVLKDAPAGFKLSGGRIPAGRDQVRMTLTAPPASQPPVNIALEGRATMNGEAILRTAVPAEDMMQAFAYRHLVPSKELQVAVSGRGMARSMKVLGDGPVKITLGGDARVQVTAPVNTERFHFELSEPPEGITIRKVSSTDQGAEILLQSDASKPNAGLKGNLIVNVFAANAPAAAGKKQTNQRRAIGTLPAIPFEITSP